MPDVEKLQIYPHMSCGKILNYSTCGEMSDFSTSVMWKNWKLLRMWRNYRFLDICHAYKSEISPHDKFFSTYLTCDTCDKYQVWVVGGKIWKQICFFLFDCLPFDYTPLDFYITDLLLYHLWTFEFKRLSHRKLCNCIGFRCSVPLYMMLLQYLLQ